MLQCKWAQYSIHLHQEKQRGERREGTGWQKQREERREETRWPGRQNQRHHEKQRMTRCIRANTRESRTVYKLNPHTWRNRESRTKHKRIKNKAEKLNRHEKEKKRHMTKQRIEQNAREIKEQCSQQNPHGHMTKQRIRAKQKRIKLKQFINWTNTWKGKATHVEKWHRTTQRIQNNNEKSRWG